MFPKPFDRARDTRYDCTIENVLKRTQRATNGQPLLVFNIYQIRVDKKKKIKNFLSSEARQ